MKFKSYYWAIIAAAVVVVLAITLPMIVFRDGGETSNPHSAEDLNNMQNEPADYTPQIEAYQDLLKANPNDALAMAGLGELYLGIGRYADSSDMYTKAVAANPKEPMFYVGLGEAEYALGMVDVALRDLQKGLEVDPNNQALLIDIGGVYAQTGKLKEAKQIWQKAYDIDPKSNLGHAAQQYITELESSQTGQGTQTQP